MKPTLTDPDKYFKCGLCNSEYFNNPGLQGMCPCCEKRSDECVHTISAAGLKFCDFCTGPGGPRLAAWIFFCKPFQILVEDTDKLTGKTAGVMIADDNGCWMSCGTCKEVIDQNDVGKLVESYEKTRPDPQTKPLRDDMRMILTVQYAAFLSGLKGPGRLLSLGKSR